MTRARRRALARALRASSRLETRYVRALRRVLRDMHEATMAFLRPHLSEVVGQKTDASLASVFDVHMGQQITRVRDLVGSLFDRHARAVLTDNARRMAVIGIRVSNLRLGPELARRRDENIQLVEKAGRAYAQSVRDIFKDPAVNGMRVEELQRRLQERGDVSASRAELIARDQTLKLNGAITQIRQETAGIDSYTWSTSLDERVRPEHAALEGRVFYWSAPPPPGHPGQDYQCRCVAVPVIPGLE